MLGKKYAPKIAVTIRTAIYNTLVSAGVDVYQGTFPENSEDLSAQQSFLASTYPTKYIDTWTPLLNPPHGIQDIYNSGDNVHPNDAGNQVIKSVVNPLVI